MFILAGSPPIVDYSVDTEITQAVSGLSHYVTEAGPRPVIKIDIPLQRRNLEVSLAKMEAASRAEAIQQILEIENSKRIGMAMAQNPPAMLALPTQRQS